MAEREFQLSNFEMLMRIHDRLGSIDAKLTNGERRHDEFTIRLERLDTKINTLEPVIGIVDRMQPLVKDYETNRNKAAGLLIALTVLAGAIGFFASELKAWLVAHV